MRPRALLAASLLFASALAAYACDNGTFNNELNTYVAPEASVYVPGEDAGEDAAEDAAVLEDVHVATEAGEGGAHVDAGDAESPADAAGDGSDLDAADSGG